MKLNRIYFFISIEHCKPFEKVELFLTTDLSVKVEINFLHGSHKYKGFNFIYRKWYEIMDIGFFRVFSGFRVGLNRVRVFSGSGSGRVGLRFSTRLRTLL